MSSRGQKFTYTCKENVYHGSLHFQWFLQLSSFCDGMQRTHTVVVQLFSDILEKVEALFVWACTFGQSLHYQQLACHNNVHFYQWRHLNINESGPLFEPMTTTTTHQQQNTSSWLFNSKGALTYPSVSMYHPQQANSHHLSKPLITHCN